MKSAFLQPPTTTVLFLTDLHLDRTGQAELNQLLNRIKSTVYDSVIITGDISDAANLRRHLSQLASACAPRPLYFLMGNHDYYQGAFRNVEDNVADLCQSTRNLHHLDGRRVIKLAEGIGLLGHRGWADARAGEGVATEIKNPDRLCIEDFRELNHQQMLHRMRALGKESAQQIRSIFPLALSCYRHVIVATHVPPFANAVFFKNQPADDQHLPYFCNLSVGLALIGISRAFPRRRVSVLAGHSHGSCIKQITHNMSVRVGASRTAGMIPCDLVQFVA